MKTEPDRVGAVIEFFVTTLLVAVAGAVAVTFLLFLARLADL